MHSVVLLFGIVLLPATIVGIYVLLIHGFFPLVQYCRPIAASLSVLGLVFMAAGSYWRFALLFLAAIVISLDLR